MRRCAMSNFFGFKVKSIDGGAGDALTRLLFL